MAKTKYKLHENPRLSANQLAEIVNASPSRRKTIIQQAKFPKTAIVAQYRDASDGIVNFLTNDARTLPNFHAKIEGLQAKFEDPSLSEWKRNDASRSAEALSAVMASYNKTGLGSLDLRALPQSKPKVNIEGVRISSSAVCSVHGVFRKQPAVGCLSLYINKSETSGAKRMEHCRSAAVVSLLYAKQHLSDYGAAVPKMNLSYDVFQGKLVQAPNGYKTRLGNMHAACESVVLWWDQIDPPSDYDGPTC
ncbi:hypothetical protein [uncultured Algimonas sp.]|uniref:hypothetical protein n=1 Tax=uncultured Algimonas sp. TaxID=1547920 RepID=UPI002602CC7A|nr:hypothetical protein [uncultured Algimonas sp.]